MAAWGAERGHQCFVATAGVVVVAAACATTRCRSGHCTERSTASTSGPTCASRSSADEVPTPPRTCTNAPPPVREFPCASAHLQLSGSPAERGAFLGKELGDEIRVVLKTWRQELYSRFAQAEGEKPTAAAEDVESWAAIFVANFLKSTEYASSTTLDRWAPGVLEELRGMATSAAVSYDELLCMQHRAECDRYGASTCDDAKNQRNEISTTVAVCGLRKTGCPALLAQSVELEPSRSDRATVLQITPDAAGIEKEQPATLLLVHAGMIAPLSGLNACGVAVSADLLPQLTCSINNSGLSAGFAVRAALATTSFEEAIHVRGLVGSPTQGCFPLGCTFACVHILQGLVHLLCK